MRFILLGFILFSLLEIGLLIWIGSNIGIFTVLMIIILTAIIGLFFGRYQGFETWNRALKSMEHQQVPAREMVDGVCILLGAVLLIMPGFISDIIGLFLLLPFTRSLFKQYIGKLLRKAADKGKGVIVYRRF